MSHVNNGKHIVNQQNIKKTTTMTHKMSDKARAAMERVVDKFKSGNLSEIIEVARIELPADAPAANWSFSNRALAYVQTGCIDNRNYGAWKKVGRQVKKGSSAAWIWKPCKYKKVDEKTGKEKWLMFGFTTTPVHPYTNTDPVPGREDVALAYEPKEPPPLADVAQALGIKFSWQPTPSCYGWCKSDGTEIAAGTHDVKTFFHELAHAVDSRLNGEGGRLKGGQDAEQETVAEFTAAVLMEYYDLGDQSGNAWRYVQHYADNPLDAVKKSLDRIGKIMAHVEDVSNGK